MSVAKTHLEAMELPLASFLMPRPIVVLSVAGDVVTLVYLVGAKVMAGKLELWPVTLNRAIEIDVRCRE